jgi:hypothetical protein
MGGLQAGELFSVRPLTEVFRQTRAEGFRQTQKRIAVWTENGG